MRNNERGVQDVDVLDLQKIIVKAGIPLEIPGTGK
jgi:hypothetical protein